MPTTPTKAEQAFLRNRPTNDQRHHFIFLNPCGCPFGLVEGKVGRYGSAADPDAAWDAMYDTRAEERAALARGVRVVHVDHATYEREFYPLMSARCPH
jgi:hypothetical protein